MNSGSVKSAKLLNVQASRSGFVSSLAKRGFLNKMANLHYGRIELQDGHDNYGFGQLTSDFPDLVRIRVHHPDFYPDIAFGGSIGAGESYMLGMWDCSDLVALMRIMLANPQVLDGINSGMALLKKPFYKLFHFLHRNSVKGSRRNIHAHYDLGNDFFRQFLDDTMMYSCAYFETEETALRDASIAKLDLICQKLALNPDDHVLEIGSGWGGFALYAARHYGCRITTTTISDAQYELARERIVAAGLEDRITLLRKDFRQLRGQYDKVVSIEMIEAIGEENISAFFEVCSNCLKPGGKMLVQAITIAEQLFENYRKSVDFIQRFIFPGGFLPSISLLNKKSGQYPGMKLLHLEDIGSHYSTTLQRWREAFHANSQAILDMGYSRDFFRLWNFYFCYCEAGFTERTTGVIHMVIEKDKHPV